MRSELAQRAAVAAVGIPLAIAAVYAGGWIFASLLAVVAAAAALEFFRIARVGGLQPFDLVGALAAAALVLAAGAARVPAAAGEVLWPLTVLLALVVLSAAVWLRGPQGRPLGSAAATLIGVVLTGGALSFGVLLREFGALDRPDPLDPRLLGTLLVLFPVVLTWINDSAAYFAGRRWGRRKLIPAVSPGKTIEGAIAGLATALLVGALYGVMWLPLPGESGKRALLGALGGALVSVAAQLGDLAESLLKREAGVKDSGGLLPGHGGVLDRFDALFFALPVAYWYLRLVLPTGESGWR